MGIESGPKFENKQEVKQELSSEEKQELEGLRQETGNVSIYDWYFGDEKERKGIEDNIKKFEELSPEEQEAKLKRMRELKEKTKGGDIYDEFFKAKESKE